MFEQVRKTAQLFVAYRNCAVAVNITSLGMKQSRVTFLIQWAKAAMLVQISTCLIATGLRSSVDIYEGLNGRGSH